LPDSTFIQTNQLTVRPHVVTTATKAGRARVNKKKEVPNVESGQGGGKKGKKNAGGEGKKNAGAARKKNG
jgi:hypothetical protein